MAHWSRVITESDAPEWISVLHADGAISEVKISVLNDVMHVHIISSADRRYPIITGEPSP